MSRERKQPKRADDRDQPSRRKFRPADGERRTEIIPLGPRAAQAMARAKKTDERGSPTRDDE